MSLVLAIKNRKSVVVASDSDGTGDHSSFGSFMTMPNRAVLLIAGNLEGVRSAVTQILPKVDPATSTAALAQLVQAALVVGVVPKLADFKGRAELIVAGFDPIRHVYEPGLYYMDSARDFYLQVVQADAVAAGTTAAVTSLLSGHSFNDSNTDHLKVLAKECVAATKLRWPGSVRPHVRLGVITQSSLQVIDF